MKLLLKSSLRRLTANTESILALANFGASSVYWLGLAFTLSVESYGKIMTLQASVALVVAVFTLRTHDLVFFLVTSHAHQLKTAYRKALNVEACTLLLSIIACALGSTLYSKFGGYIGSTYVVGGLALLSALANSQGASIAKLRYDNGGRLIAAADFATLGCWALSVTALFAADRFDPLTMLLIGAVPQAMRTILLYVLAIGRGGLRNLQSDASLGGARVAINFLLGAQFTNIFKNGALSLETMLLAAFCPPAIVAQYRLARSTLGIANAVINVEYQRNYALLSRTTNPAHRSSLVFSLTRRSVLLCILSTPLSLVIALAYGLSKAEVDVLTLQLVTLGTSLSFIPTALQQGPVILLLLKGMHRSINAAYAMSTGVLVALSGAMFFYPSIFTFLFATMATGVMRHSYLYLKSRPLMASAGKAEKSVIGRPDSPR